MDQRFIDMVNKPENQIFQVVFFPDRIYHAAYLNATVSKRYRYNVTEVRNKGDITFMKAEVFQDGQFLANVLRIEYEASRLKEVARESTRFLQNSVIANLSLVSKEAEAINVDVKLSFCNWVRAFQVEIWDTLEPITGSKHHFKVLAQMGKDGPITHIAKLDGVLKEIKDIKVFDIQFRENDTDEPFGYKINNPAIDNNFGRTYQKPVDPTPSSPRNTIPANVYELNFQRGWFLDSKDVEPVRYRNAMMESVNPAYKQDNSNIVEMKWILQQEMGGDLVYFHEVTVTPGSFEGVHQHIGSEELYYIVSGEGIAYMGDGDDPALDDKFPTVSQQIYSIGNKPVKEIPVKPGKIIYTKSGGIHGIRNPSTTTPLVFVAFGYHCS